MSKTYEEIMAEMMAEMPDDVSTEEGSLIYNSCAKQALQLEEAYLSMQRVEDNMHTDTQDEEHLILNGKDKGVEIKEATKAIVQADFSQEIEIGSRFTANDLNYTVTELISGFSYKLECEEEGTEGNIASGELSPIDYVDDYQGGSIVAVLVPGEEQEDIEEYRKKVLEIAQTKYFGGNRADYVRFIEALDGVGSCKVKRRTEEDKYIYPFITNSSYEVPSTDLVNTVQTAVNPAENDGEGDGIAPIGHFVKIKPAEEVVINITATIQYADGYSQEALQSQINSVIDAYFLELKKEWRDSEELIVRVAQIEARIIGIVGIKDISGTALNGSESNATLSYSQIPGRGTVNGV